jgi:hypothetical protein
VHPEGFALADEWPSREVWPGSNWRQTVTQAYAAFQNPSISGSHAAIWFQLVKMRPTNSKSLILND